MKGEPNLESELRRDYFQERYVVIAPKRNLRPDSFAAKSEPHRLETATSPAIEKDPAILNLPHGAKDWQVRVVGNIFPALSPDNKRAYGKQEVIVETPDHNVEFSELSLDHLMIVFEAYKQRLEALSKLPDVRYVSVFKNDGPAAGASIAHAHSQIVALPLVPPDLEAEAEAVDKYFDQFERCPVCDMWQWEAKQEVRLVFEDKSIAAVTPYASRFPFEVWITPKHHTGNFCDLSKTELRSIATIIKNITSKLDSINVSYNFFLQNALAGRDHHFLLKIEPRPGVWAGLELATGVILNPVSPEYSALWYRGQVS